MKKLFLTALIILFISCGKTTEKETQTTTKLSQLEKVSKTNKKEREIKTIKTDSLIIENKILHKFSQIDKDDEFYICIKGTSILKGKAVFKINNSDGIEIYKVEFPSIELINPDLSLGIDAPIKDQKLFIKKRILEFFDKNNFISPAINKDDIFDEDYSDKEIWFDIKSDKTAIGFHYLVGEEDGRSVAYSKKTKKVIIYFNCC